MASAPGHRSAWPVWVALGVAAILAHLLQWALLPFVLAAILGFVTDPAVRWLMHRTRAPRWLAAGALYVVLLMALGGLAAGVGWAAWRELSHMAGTGLQPLRSDLQQVLGTRGVTLFGLTVDADTVVDFFEAQAHRFLTAALLIRTGKPAAEGAVGIVLLIFLSFYAMVSGPKLVRGALWLVPPSRRQKLERMLPPMRRAVQSYFIGVLMIVAFTTVAAWLGYGLGVHVRNAFLLSLAVGVLETMPAVGAAVSALLVAMAALQLHSLTAGAVMIAYAAALRLTIDDLIAPVVLGRFVRVHPVVVMLAYTFGALLFGVVGLLLAVPAAACIRIALHELYEGEAPDQAAAT